MEDFVGNNLPPELGFTEEQREDLQHYYTERNKGLRFRRAPYLRNTLGIPAYEERPNPTLNEKLDDIKLILSKDYPQHLSLGGHDLDWKTAADDLHMQKDYRTLRVLRKVAIHGIGGDLISKYEEDLEGSWMDKRHFEGHPDDRPVWAATRENENVFRQGLSRDLRNFSKMTESQIDHSTFRFWGKIHDMFNLVQYLILVERFLDPRNPEIKAPPLADGSNLEDKDLRSSWGLHRAWLRVLHYRSLSFGGRVPGIQELAEIVLLARAFQEMETRRTPLANRQILSGFEEIKMINRILVSCLGKLAAEYRANAIPPVATSSELTPSYNIDSEKVEASWNRITAGIVPDVYDTIKLWSILIGTVRKFNLRSDEHYVEDCVFEKRVLVEDEAYNTILDLRDQYAPNLAAYRPRDEAGEREARQLARRITQINRERRNFNLLRDWSKKRPWKQLYFVYDTINLEDLRTPIKDFYATMERLRRIDPPNDEIKANSPSNKGNIFGGIFPIHPVYNHTAFLHGGKHYDGTCMFCIEEYKPGETLVRLHCDHFFHFHCIAHGWDEIGTYTYSCPMCKKESSWQLHHVAGIIPEVVDLWDKAILVDEEQALMDPNVLSQDQARVHLYDDNERMVETEMYTTTYWQHEAQLLENSNTRHLMDNPPCADYLTEMSQTRNARRKRLTAEWRDRGPEPQPRPPLRLINVVLNTPPTVALDVFVFGTGFDGVLGLGVNTPQCRTPRRMRTLQQIVQIAPGPAHCIALTRQQVIYTWGDNTLGQLGRNTTQPEGALVNANGMNPLEATPILIDTTFLRGRRATQVAATNLACFVLTEDGDVYGWGTFADGEDTVIGFTGRNANLADEAGEGDDNQERIMRLMVQRDPIKIEGLWNITSLAAGRDHMLALDKDGKVYTWGSDQYGSLGRRYPERKKYRGDTDYYACLNPTAVLYEMKYIAAGAYHSFAISKNDEVLAWGKNDWGQTGIPKGPWGAPPTFNDDAYVPIPTIVEELIGLRIKSVNGGNDHSIATTGVNEVLVFGRCSEFQAGSDVDDLDQHDIEWLRPAGDALPLLPQILRVPRVMPEQIARGVVAGDDCCFVINEAGHAYAWGVSDHFRTGLNTEDPVGQPARIIPDGTPPDMQIIFIGAGRQYGVLAGPLPTEVIPGQPMSRRISFTINGTMRSGRYANFARKTAQKHNMVGTCHYTFNGALAGEAQGPEDLMEAFISELQAGPQRTTFPMVITSFETQNIPLGPSAEAKFSINI